jgi:hypothetical protein
MLYASATHYTLGPYPMRKFTLDTNCIIDLEEDRPDGIFVQEIVQAWKDGRIELAVVAVSASENQKSGTINRNYVEFERKIEKVGLAGVEQLLPLMMWDIFYWDHALWADKDKEGLATAIQGVLFPNTKLDPPEDIERNSSWRNKQCDVLTAWAHAFHKWDCLVTRDTNFHNHKAALRELGIAEILHPKEAAELCRP